METVFSNCDNWIFPWRFTIFVSLVVLEGHHAGRSQFAFLFFFWGDRHDGHPTKRSGWSLRFLESLQTLQVFRKYLHL